MLRGKVIIKPQEEEGKSIFVGVESCMTIGFKNTFGNEAEAIAFTALALILETYPNNADYLQSFEYQLENMTIKFWCINDVDHITYLLPSEY